MTARHVSRRTLLVGGLGAAGVGVVSAWTASRRTTSAGPLGPPPAATPAAGQRVTTASLTAKPTTLDLGGRTVQTWAYGDAVPGPTIRARAGDFLRVTVDNALPADTSVHWHGIRLRNAADGIPGVTQDPIGPGTRYVYEYTAPDPGTYFFHPHSGVQLDRGLYAPLLVDDPAEPGRYDAEWVVVLDDWIDGTGTTPDEVFQQLTAGSGPAAGGTTGSAGGMSGMGGMGGMAMGPPPFGDGGDVKHPYFLVNGKAPADPVTFSGKPGQKVRLRVINAAADTVFTVAVGGHRLILTHTDGHAVQPTEAGAFYIGMGERYDATVTLGDGAFPLVAVPFNKPGRALAVVRTGAGATPGADATPAELAGPVLLGSSLLPTEAARLPAGAPDAATTLLMTGQMQPYQWYMNGAPYGSNTPLTVPAGQRLRIRVRNMTMMAHPLHLHGHTFALADSGLRKDTLLLRPMESRDIDLDADNTGDWMVHCHNIYHAEAGMMILLRYA